MNKPTTMPTIGQEVAIGRPLSFGTSYQLARIRSISPSGSRIVVENGDYTVSFRNNLEEGHTGSRSRRAFLEFDVAGVRAMQARESQAQAIASKLNEVQALGRAQSTWDLDSFAERIDAIRALLSEAEDLMARPTDQNSSESVSF